MKKKKGITMSLLTMIVIFIAVLALSIALFNPGGIIEGFKEMLEKLVNEGAADADLSSGNKGLHIHLGGNGGDELYEFHLFNNLNHKVKQEIASLKIDVNLAIKNWKKDKCTVFLSDSSSSPTYLWSVKAIGGNRIYYVDEGTIVQDGVKSMEDVLRGYVGDCKCIEKDQEREEYTMMSSEGCGVTMIKPSHVCWGVKPTIEAKFGETKKENCEKYKQICPKDGCCQLLYKTDLGNYIFRIKYGVICGYKDGSEEAYWWACTEDNEGMEVSAKGKKYICEFKEGIGLWKEKTGQ